MPDFSSCAKKLGASFNNLDLLVEALTHRSYLNEHREYVGSHNERLEFLGDAVLELAVTDFLLRNSPQSRKASSPVIAPRSSTPSRLPSARKRSASAIFYCFPRVSKRTSAARAR